MTIANAYGLAVQSMLNKQIDFDSDTVKCILLGSAYTPNQDTHRYKSDLSAEVTGTGYTAGGVTLTGKTVTYDGPSNTLTLDANDPQWLALTVTGIRFAVFYVDTGVAGTSPLISYMDFEADSDPAAQDFTINLPVTGIIQFTV